MEQLEELKMEMEDLKEQRKELSKRILKLWYKIHYIETQRPHRQERVLEKSLSYQMFGKSYSELTQDELKEYNKEAQMRHRQRKKGDNNN